MSFTLDIDFTKEWLSDEDILSLVKELIAWTDPLTPAEQKWATDYQNTPEKEWLVSNVLERTTIGSQLLDSKFLRRPEWTKRIVLT